MDESFCLLFGHEEDPVTEFDNELSELSLNETQSYNQLPPEVTLLLLLLFTS